MKKVCFVLANHFKYFKGGAELQAYFIAKELAKKIEVHYLFMKHPNFNKIEFQKNDQGVILHPMKQHIYKKFGKFFFMNYRELIKRLDEIKPDLIYQRGGKPYIGMAKGWCKKNKKKCVFGISMESNCSKSGILRLSNNFFTYPSNIINGYLTFYGINYADLIIAQSQIQQGLLLQNFKRNSILIPNGQYVPNPPFEKTEPPIISWIANIKKLKQPEIFLKLAEKLQTQNIKFVFAGRPDKGSYQKKLIEKAKKLSNFEYLGEIPLEKTNELLSKSSILINTSSTEGFSNTYIQSWMRETPVVTLNCDPDDIIKNHRIGFHSGSFKQMVKDVIYLLENERERKEMGKKARKYALVNYDMEKIGKKYLDTFHQLVQD